MIKDVLKVADEKMSKTIAVLKRELASMKAGRANPAMLDRIEEEYYGAMTSRIVAMSFCEPRSWTRVLSS